MNNNKTVDIIFHSIEKKFSKGFSAGEDLIHFAQSTLGIETIEEIAGIICRDMDDTGILSLLMVPDFEIRRIVEKNIPQEGISQDDENLIIAKAVSSIKDTSVELPGIYSFNVNVPDHIHAHYVKKLMLTKKVPCRDILPVDGSDAELNIDVLIHLRKYATGFWHREEIIICDIISALRIKKHGFGEIAGAVDFVSTMFKRFKNETDILSLISTEKKFWMKMLERKHQFEKAVVKYSMEFMMMQRINPGIYSLEDIEKKIETADMILIALNEPSS